MTDHLERTPAPLSSSCVDCGKERPGQRLSRGRCKACYFRWWKKAKADGTFVPLDKTRPLADRLFEKVAAGPNGCILFTGHLNNNGYGTTSPGGNRGKSIYAHRAAYELLVGPIPPGLVLDHLCRTPRCINPYHLEPVTQVENMRRAAAYRTHCPHGHAYTDENVIYRPGRGRECKVCRREWRRPAALRAAQASVAPADGEADAA